MNQRKVHNVNWEILFSVQILICDISEISYFYKELVVGEKAKKNE